jgi:glycine oxidase
VKTWDAIVIGGGLIGLSLAISLRKQGMRVLVVERTEPGREASSAAAGMLAASGREIPPVLRPLTEQSAQLYPEFVHELEDESGLKVDLRDHGTILVSAEGTFPEAAEPLSPDRAVQLEPALHVAHAAGHPFAAAYLRERSVDPRALVAATLQAARHRGVDIASGTEVLALAISNGRAAGVETEKTSYSAPVVINCAGAWAGGIGPQNFPVRPVKGQMLAVVGGPQLRHTVRGDEAYLVPRTDGRILIGSTLEDAGYNKQTEAATINALFRAALALVPALAQAKRHEDWAGLRPGTPDDLPILGKTSSVGYFVACGHYRDGILLTPITAKLMTQVVLGQATSFDLTPFSAARSFAQSNK